MPPGLPLGVDVDLGQDRLVVADADPAVGAAALLRIGRGEDQRELERCARVVDDSERGVDRGRVVAVAVAGARLDVDERGLPEDGQRQIGKRD